MKLKDFEARMQIIKVGDFVTLYIRGNYGTYAEAGNIRKIENGYVYLEHGFAHSYKRIISIRLAEVVGE